MTETLEKDSVSAPETDGGLLTREELIAAGPSSSYEETDARAVLLIEDIFARYGVEEGKVKAAELLAYQSKVASEYMSLASYLKDTSENSLLALDTLEEALGHLDKVPQEKMLIALALIFETQAFFHDEINAQFRRFLAAEDRILSYESLEVSLGEETNEEAISIVDELWSTAEATLKARQAQDANA